MHRFQTWKHWLQDRFSQSQSHQLQSCFCQMLDDGWRNTFYVDARIRCQSCPLHPPCLHCCYLDFSAFFSQHHSESSSCEPWVLHSQSSSCMSLVTYDIPQPPVWQICSHQCWWHQVIFKAKEGRCWVHWDWQTCHRSNLAALSHITEWSLLHNWHTVRATLRSES